VQPTILTERVSILSFEKYPFDLERSLHLSRLAVLGALPRQPNFGPALGIH
jgi:hypothetical protein